MKKLLKKIVSPILQKWYRKKSSTITTYSKFGLKLAIYPSVFHPGIFYSTKIFIRFMETLPIANSTLLELGAGNGLLAMRAVQLGAKVTASEINQLAIQGLKENTLKNNLSIDVITSDLFEQLSIDDFEYIFINPPYYAKNPTNDTEKAFYCGENFEYFNRLFKQLSKRSNQKTEVYMILSEDVVIDAIRKIASVYHCDLKPVKAEKNWWERNYIFEVVNQIST